MYLSHAVQKLELFKIKRLYVAKSEKISYTECHGTAWFFLLFWTLFSGYNCSQKNKASYAPVNNDNISTEKTQKVAKKDECDFDKIKENNRYWCIKIINVSVPLHPTDSSLNRLFFGWTMKMCLYLQVAES